MARSLRWTSSDLDLLPDDGKRYEIIDGELYVSKTPSLAHQAVSTEIVWALHQWDLHTGTGAVYATPGIVFADDDDVVPDIVWISKERLVGALDGRGHLTVAPELIIEVLSPGASNERRDREAKLKLYSRRGVSEYWIVDWQRRRVEVYRRFELALRLEATLLPADALASPLLPGFSLPVADLFARLPSA